MTELTVANLGQAVDWYVEVLGLKVELLDQPRGFALLNATSGRIALKEGSGSRPTGGVRLAFEVADIIAESRRLNITEVVDDPEGFRSFQMVDPDGNPITLFAWNREREGSRQPG